MHPSRFSPKLNRSVSNDSFKTNNSNNGPRNQLIGKCSESFNDCEANDDETNKVVIFSRYHADFEEQAKLASGGFGSVYRVSLFII